jgi:hypothetical protein
MNYFHNPKSHNQVDQIVISELHSHENIGLKSDANQTQIRRKSDAFQILI